MAAKKARRQLSSRDIRLVPKHLGLLSVLVKTQLIGEISGQLVDISKSGVAFLGVKEARRLTLGDKVEVVLFAQGEEIACGDGEIKRITPVEDKRIEASLSIVGIAFSQRLEDQFNDIKKHLVDKSYVREELRGEGEESQDYDDSGMDQTLADFYREDSPDLFAKCRTFYKMVSGLQQKQMYQALYRVTLTTKLDNRIIAYNPMTSKEEEKICFDSNSYLGLHCHPRVIEATNKALSQMGYGTPSSQLLGGTNRYLRELEDTLSEYHGREDAIIFPDGYGTNVGTITALIRESDVVVRDYLSHASIHDGALCSLSRSEHVYSHLDMQELEKILERAESSVDFKGKLVATDGVFTMHGDIAPLPKLVELTNKYNAKLMVDEGLSVGVFGKTGRGLEEHFNLNGSIDILVGSLSRSAGTIGGYVCGNRNLINYLRFYARSNFFSATLPSHICAGATEAYKLMNSEPHHREKLWRNVKTFKPSLENAGFIVSGGESPILTVFMGATKLLWSFSRDLFDMGVKCGSVDFPAVPRNTALLRFTLNANHTEDDLEEATEIMAKLGKKYGILNKSKEEICEVGENLFKKK